MEEVYTYSAKACQEKTCYIIVASCYFETRIGMPPLSNASAFISIRLLIRSFVSSAPDRTVEEEERSERERVNYD